MAEGEEQPVLGLHHLRRAVEPHPLRVAGEVGDGDHQVERLTAGQQQRPLRLRRHSRERIEQQAGEHLAAERRREPAGADELRQLGPHLAARAALDRGVDRVLGRAAHQPRQRHRPDLGQPRPRPRIGIEQHGDIGLV